MMNPQKQITTNAPSIRYEGDLRPEQAGIMQKHAQAMQQMIFGSRSEHIMIL